MSKSLLESKIRVIPDFPKPGILFRDVSSWFENQDCLLEIRKYLADEFKLSDADKVVGIESRGFVGGAILAERIHAGFVMARKPGKLPGKAVSVSYNKEYGTDSIEIGEGSIKEGDVVIIHDDLLATGGTALAVYNLVMKFKPSKVIFSFLVEIRDDGLKGRELLESTGCEIHALITT